EGMAHAPRIALLLREVGQHRRDDAGVDPCRGVVVHVDRGVRHSRRCWRLDARCSLLDEEPLPPETIYGVASIQHLVSSIASLLATRYANSALTTICDQVSQRSSSARISPTGRKPASWLSSSRGRTLRLSTSQMWTTPKWT